MRKNNILGNLLTFLGMCLTNFLRLQNNFSIENFSKRKPNLTTSSGCFGICWGMYVPSIEIACLLRSHF